MLFIQGQIAGGRDDNVSQRTGGSGPGSLFAEGTPITIDQARGVIARWTCCFGVFSEKATLSDACDVWTVETLTYANYDWKVLDWV